MKDLILPRFEHRLGKDCATSAMRNLLSHYGLDLTEAMVFGLGEGLASWYCHWEQAPFPLLITQNPSLEEDLAKRLGISLKIHDPAGRPGDDPALNLVRAGTPVIVKADPYYLNYCWKDGTQDRRHFGEHILILVAIDGSDALVSDIWSDRLERVPLAEVHQARFALEGEPYLLPRGRWYELSFPKSVPNLLACGYGALQGMAIRNLSEVGVDGIAGLHTCAERLPQILEIWSNDCLPQRHEWISIISMRMDEGGLRSGFRSLFFDFLSEFGALADDSRLSSLSLTFRSDAEAAWRLFLDGLQQWTLNDDSREARRAHAAEIRVSLCRIADLEKRMWKELWI